MTRSSPAAATRKVHPVVLSGGSGTRLWPLSRAAYPKQLLPLASSKSMLQETVGRFQDPAPYAAPMIICNNDHRFIVAEQMREMAVAPTATVLEPVGRNTAPAAAVAALLLTRAAPDALILVLPADHVIQNPSRFHTIVASAVDAAAGGQLVTFGMAPMSAETGYGYIRRGAPLAGSGFRVDRFAEKPDRATAEGYLKDGGYYWNSGMFLFSAAAYLAELERLQPEILAACRGAIDAGRTDLDFFRLDKAAFAESPAISIDYAVMEHTERAVVFPAEIGWSDVGSWTALWEIGEKDARGNVCLGDVITHETRGCYIRSERPLVATVGVENLVITVTEDAVLVADKDRAQDVKEVVEALKRGNRSEYATHLKVYRPWGYYESLDAGELFQVKHLMVKPGEKLSLQMHHHRAEHWIVVHGTARVTRGEEQILLSENQSTYIPLGTLHRLENPGKMPLHLIEVQSGTYLGEDDIVRFEDTYGRA
ncbi:MAG: mannose-1-phosphate guanylyltransferase/mannose-6-phosphate isomerase [Alphaproteobacteria bacterium]|nr:mannose-1-phosphate guanylyltransferase/mannose-6-phosphate isomerase [Alphaproteobacteria bacterium]